MGIVVKQGFWNSIFGYLGIGLGYANMVLLFPHFLTTEQFGLTRVLLAAGMIMAQLGQLGVINLTVNFFPQFKDQSKRHNGFFFFMLLVPAIGFLVVALLAYLFKPTIIEFYTKDSPIFGEFFWYLFPLALLVIYFNALDGYLRALFKTVMPYFLRTVFLRLEWFVLIILFSFDVLTFGQFVFWFVASHAGMVIIEVVYLVYLGELHLKPDFSYFSKPLLKKMATYCGFAILGTSSSFLAQRLDIVMLGGMVDLSTVAIYSVAFYVASVIAVPLASVGSIVGSLISDAWQRNDMDQIATLYRKTSDSQLALAYLVFLGIWCNIDSLFYFLPEDYRGAHYVFLMVGLAKLFDVGTGSVGYIIMYSKWYRMLLLFNVALMILTVLTNYLLIPPFQMEGAALATMLSILIYNLGKYGFVWWKLGIQPFNRKTVIALAAAFAALGAAWLLPNLGNVYLDVAVRSTIIIIVYCPVIYYYKVSDELNGLIRKALGLVGVSLPKH